MRPAVSCDLNIPPFSPAKTKMSSEKIYFLHAVAWLCKRLCTCESVLHVSLLPLVTYLPVTGHAFSAVFRYWCLISTVWSVNPHTQGVSRRGYHYIRQPSSLGGGGVYITPRRALTPFTLFIATTLGPQSREKLLKGDLFGAMPTRVSHQSIPRYCASVCNTARQ